MRWWDTTGAVGKCGRDSVTKDDRGAHYYNSSIVPVYVKSVQRGDPQAVDVESVCDHIHTAFTWNHLNHRFLMWNTGDPQIPYVESDQDSPTLPAPQLPGPHLYNSTPMLYVNLPSVTVSARLTQSVFMLLCIMSNEERSMLTATQSKLINTAKHTHDYEAEALASYAASGDDMMEALQERFEACIDYDDSDDLGGLCVYFREGVLVAFYDYEQFHGSDALAG